ncbi:MAG: PepSY domain-containing protein [Planctomycetota bacterium]|nr:PepSY domain-containing protein [Planctomycetaceae bacterium]MDQ3331795.1 PepSY domain-containing protein [Planctomycetota bacterium]
MSQAASAALASAGPADAALEPTGKRGRRLSANKLLFAVHGWLGLSLGLPLFVICLSGTFAVVSHEIDWLLTPAVRAPSHDGPVNWGAVAANVRRRHPDAPLTLLTAPVGRGFAAQAWIDTPHGIRRIFADPATGEVTGETGWFNTQRFFRDFHRRFFWYSAWGVTLVSSFAIVLLFSVGTGLLFYKRWWAKLFTLRFHKGGRVFWSDLHRLTGVWTLLFAGLIAATGFWYLVEGPATRAMKDRSGKPSAEMTAERLAALGPVATPLPIEEIVRLSQQAHPGLRVTSISLPARLDDPVGVSGQATAWLVRERANHVRLDPFSGAVLSRQRADDLAPGVRLIDTVDPLHFGDFGGLAVKLIWFGFALLLSALMPTGVYLWLKRAEQTAAGVAKRLREEPDADIAREVRRATRRRTGVGLVATTAILLWAAFTTFRALADELPRPAPPRSETSPRAVGPWTVTAFRQGTPVPGESANFGLRFDDSAGHANFRRASLALAATTPQGTGWRDARGFDERVAELDLPAAATGRERLWVSVEAWDGTRHTADFRADAFVAAGGYGPARLNAGEALGGPRVIAFYGGFVALLAAVTVVWSRVVWFRRRAVSKPPGLGDR